MDEISIRIRNLGKMYKLFSNPSDKVLDALGLSRLFAKGDSRYQSFWAIRDINLDIMKGERVGIVGHNGAGKSTLLKVICGNLAPTEGEAKVDGRIQALMELGTGFHPEFTGRENIAASLSYLGLNRSEILAREAEIVEFAELEEFIDQPIKTYSAGMYARLAFSAATSLEPELLIIDEVLGAGDAYFAGKCFERMRKLTHDTGATVLFVSHDLGSMQALCERTIWMERGTIKMDGDPLEVSKAYYKQVQKREHKRHVARRLSVRQADLDSETKHYISRFRTSGGDHPKGDNKIRAVTLRDNNGVLSELDIGAPMDNDAHAPNHVLCAAGYMNWSEPQKDTVGRYRNFTDVKGRYFHAPFMLEIASMDWTDLALEIDADTQEDVYLDISIDDVYVVLGCLERGAASTSFSLSTLKTGDASLAAENQAELDR